MALVTTKEHNRLFNAFGPDDARLLEHNISERVPFYVRMQISPFEARMGYLLNLLVLGDRKPSVPYLSFFCSSTSEALSGSLKLVRHNHSVHKPGLKNITAVYDPTHSLQEMFDPLSRGIEEALVPGLAFFDSIDSFRDFAERDQPSSLLLRHANELPLDTLADILQRASTRNIYTILDESSTDLAETGPICSQLETMPDVIAFGENLGDHRVPTGCFMMTKSMFKVWNNSNDYNIHSNTWGGNSISLATVLKFLETTPCYKRLPLAAIETLGQAVHSHLTATKLYAAHCSPKMATMLNISGLNKNIRSAHKARIDTISRHGAVSVIDASGTYGVNLQGHNPDDVLDAVVTSHDVTHDYWSGLQALLQRKTGFPHIFPAVSGATAIEAAMAIALLAGAPKKKVIGLKLGFGGKTLISLISTSRERFKAPFGPLYPHVSYVDPFNSDGQRELMRHLETGDVAVVILETVQGEGGVRSCPQDFLDFLNRQKEAYGFLIAIDEIQTGMYRTGQFLNHTGKVAAPDIVAIGKAMSDNVFPVSATLVSEEVFQQARQTNASAVARYANLYRCQFGAQMAIHAIQSGERAGLAEHAKTAGEYFRRRLRETTGNLDFVKDIRGEGLMIGIEFDRDKLPRLLRGTFGGLLASRFVNDPKQPVLVAFNPDKPLLIRFVPPLCITTAEIDAIVETTGRALRSGFWGLLKPIVVNTLNAKLGRM